MDETALNKAISALLSRAGLSATGLTITACTGGGNNRVFRVDAGGRIMVAKHYFRHPTDMRDRLNSEYAFLEYARQAGISCVPRAVARDDQAGTALYEFIEGSKLQTESPSCSQVQQAQDFFVRLNEAKPRVLGKSLPNASEACFSIFEHLQLVQGRIDQLAEIPATSRIDEDAIGFAALLRARWTALSEQVLSEAVTHGIEPKALLADQDRCISPSDFGFHNAIVTPTGKVLFIDFEYAGWDDPAKAVSDFFCHPAVLVPFEYFDSYLAAALNYSDRPEQLARRTRILLPVFRIKWCCIVMNDFLPLFEGRRFADPAIEVGVRKQLQLEKARRILETVH